MNTHGLAGEKIKELREERGLSVREVAHRSENAFTHSYVSSLENHYASWNHAGLDKLKGFARAFDMSLEDLISFVENRRPKHDPNDNLDDYYKPIPSYHLTASSTKGVLTKVADEKTLLPDTDFLYDLIKLFKSSDDKKPYLRLLVRKGKKGVKAGHRILVKTKEWGTTVARVRVIKGKEYSLDDQVFMRSDILKEKEIDIMGIVKATTELHEEPE
jgi:transcriptional regulator with XRE-family HTH domain